METILEILEIQVVKTNSEKVLARVDVHFKGFWLKGFKVLYDSKESKDYVTPPSYQSSMGWRTLFKTDLKEDWQEIQRRILEDYNRQQMKEAIDEN